MVYQTFKNNYEYIYDHKIPWLDVTLSEMIY